jgi:FlaA1/EpsC-like NDP-sugar epimerase
MIPLAWVGAYWLRFNLESIPEPYLGQALKVLPVVIIVHVSVFLYFGLYRGVWRFASIPDLIRITKAVVVAVAVSDGLRTERFTTVRARRPWWREPVGPGRCSHVICCETRRVDTSR